MLMAFLTAFVTYFYLQWPAIVSALGVAVWAIGAITFILFITHVIVSNNSESREKEFLKQKEIKSREDFDKKWNEDLAKFEKTLRKSYKIFLVVVLLNVFVPNQKTLGTSVAVGAATYLTYEVITSDVVQKFIKMVSLQANSFLDGRIEELQSSRAASEPAK